VQHQLSRGSPGQDHGSQEHYYLIGLDVSRGQLHEHSVSRYNALVSELNGCCCQLLPKRCLRDAKATFFINAVGAWYWVEETMVRIFSFYIYYNPILTDNNKMDSLSMLFIAILILILSE
jgi:hypothetical protein